MKTSLEKDMKSGGAEILSAFQWVIHDLYHKLNWERRPQTHSICFLFSYCYSRIQRKKSNNEEKNAANWKELLLLATPCHIKIQNVTLSENRTCIAHLFKQTDKDCFSDLFQSFWVEPKQEVPPKIQNAVDSLEKRWIVFKFQSEKLCSAFQPLSTHFTA